MFQFEEEMLGTQIGKPSLDMAKPSLDMALMHMCILLTGRHLPFKYTYQPQVMLGCTDCSTNEIRVLSMIVL